MEQKTIVFVLPYPPSVNHYWRTAVKYKNGKPFVQTYISKEGIDYRTNVYAAVLSQLKRVPKKRTGRLELSVVLFPPDQRKRDIDNPIKALLDALTHAGVWEDDSQIDELFVVRGPVVQHGAAKIFLEEVE